jgi:hypothetical protein
LLPGEKIVSASMTYNRWYLNPNQIKFLVVKTPHKVINPHHFCSNSISLYSKKDIQEVKWNDLPQKVKEIDL